MNDNKNSQAKKILIIAGSDSGGCAGIQADLKVANYLSCHGSTAITAITAQNTLGVQQIKPLASKLVRDQILSILEDMGADAIKIGMLFNTEIISTVAEILTEFSSIPIVLDPVCIATSGARLIEKSALECLMNKLFPLSEIITPNLQEFYVICRSLGVEVESSDNGFLQKLKVKNCLVTGGDDISSKVIDKLYLQNKEKVIEHKQSRIHSMNTHGSGCSLSTAITVFMAQGIPLVEAVEQGIALIRKGIYQGKDKAIGQGPGPLWF